MGFSDDFLGMADWRLFCPLRDQDAIVRARHDGVMPRTLSLSPRNAVRYLA
jgi:hypothetical protein